MVRRGDVLSVLYKALQVIQLATVDRLRITKAKVAAGSLYTFHLAENGGYIEEPPISGEATEVVR
jgi:hypothetical protein